MNSNEITSTHTPGPWHIDPYGANDTGNMLIKPIPGPVVCEIEPTEEAKANARLIAAAPELLEALDYLLEETLLLDLAVGNELLDKQATAWDMATAAIAKATGMNWPPGELRA